VSICKIRKNWIAVMLRCKAGNRDLFTRAIRIDMARTDRQGDTDLRFTLFMLRSLRAADMA
jgi:hypothetical protein